jgi:hypothetical protein
MMADLLGAKPYGTESGRWAEHCIQGFRLLNTFKAHSDKRQIESLLNRNGFSGLSELGEAEVDDLTRSSMGWRRSVLPEWRLRTNMRGPS